jgi:HCOMODA/2-hydroxy-3-carboxy-muconic semialdehyde decarboxylase
MEVTALHNEATVKLLEAARVIAGAGLADAFGHVSVRVGDSLLITGPTPLAFQRPDDLSLIPIDAATLPSAAPKEAWIHLAIAQADEDTRAICRAQPRSVAGASASQRNFRPLDGQGAMLGSQVPVYDDSRLVRDGSAGAAVAELLGDSPAIILRGNGAITRGPDLASAVARMWLLERSAQLLLAVGAEVTGLPDDEQAWWRERDAELLPRIYDYLVRIYAE